MVKFYGTPKIENVQRCGFTAFMVQGGHFRHHKIKQNRCQTCFLAFIGEVPTRRLPYRDVGAWSGGGRERGRKWRGKERGGKKKRSKGDVSCNVLSQIFLKLCPALLQKIISLSHHCMTCTCRPGHFFPCNVTVPVPFVYKFARLKVRSSVYIYIFLSGFHALSVSFISINKKLTSRWDSERELF